MELINIGEEDDLGKFISSEVDDHALARRLQEEEEAQARPSIESHYFILFYFIKILILVSRSRAHKSG